MRDVAKAAAAGTLLLIRSADGVLPAGGSLESRQVTLTDRRRHFFGRGRRRQGVKGGS
jgi:hypothetical protein